MIHDTHTVQIGSASFDPSTQRLRRGEHEVRLHPKDMGVLLELVARAPEVVSREELLEHVWAGTIVGENALDQVIARLRHALGDDARHPGCIETLPKRGYRLMVPVVRIAAALTNGAAEYGTRDDPFWLITMSFLPLTTIGSDPSLAEYAQIVSEDIACHLTEMKSVRIIVPKPIRHAGRLPAFVAQGNVRRIADQIRVSVQVFRTDSGDVLWSETFDESLQSVAAGQFARAPLVARTIEAVVNNALWADSAATVSEEARKQFFYGICECQSVTLGLGGDFSVAVEYFERALQLDPDIKEALYVLANLYALRVGGRMRAERAIPRAHQMAVRLLRLDSDATLALGAINSDLDFDYGSAMANLQHSHKRGYLDLAYAEYQKGLVCYKQGRLDEAIARLQGAIGMGLAYHKANALFHLAHLFHAAGRDERAMAAIEEGQTCAGPRWLNGRLLRLEILHSMGCLDQAQREIEEAWQQFGESDAPSFPGVLAMLGRSDHARSILRANETSWREGQLAIAADSFSGHYHLDEFDQAFVWLQRAIENREWALLPYLRCDRFYGNIRRDVRFGYVMHRLAEIEAMGSPTRSIATR